MNELEHLSAEWVEKNLYRFPWYKPLFNQKIKKIEMRSLEFEDELESENES